MAVASASEKLTTELAITHYDFDPDSGDATDVGWVDMRDYDKIVVSFFRTIGTGALTTFTILANSSSTGASTDVEIKSHALGSQPDAVGDYVFLECTAKELAAAGTDLRYVSANIDFVTSTDEGVVTYVRGGSRWVRDSQSSDTVA